MRLSLLTVLFFLLGTGVSFAIDEPDSFQIQRLPLGEEGTRFDLVRIPLNGFFSSRLGTLTTSEEAFVELGQARVVLIGEGHTNDQHHQLQLKVIRGLVERGRKVVIALEMFNPAQNDALADFSSGRISEAEFLAKADWVNVWGHDYRYYRPIFAYSRQHGLPLMGVNLPHQLVSKVAMGGLKSVPEGELKGVPVPEATNQDHRFLVNAMMQGIGALSPEIFANMYISQCLWDAGMGEGAIRVANQFPEHVVVVLAGTGHVAYRLGIARIIRRRSPLPVLAVMPVDVALPAEKKGKDAKGKSASSPAKSAFMVHMGDSNPDAAYPHEIVSRNLADFLVGVPAEKKEKYPSLGVSLKNAKDGKLTISRVMPDSLADKAGLTRGDVILMADGKGFASATAFKTFLSSLNWGDSLNLDLQGENGRRRVRMKVE